MRKHIIAGVAALAALTAGIAIPASAASTADNSSASDYHAVAPVRLVDTRATHQTLTAGGVLKLTVAGTHGVPADATSVTVNVTATGGTQGGFLTAYPDGSTRPTASSVNFAIGQTIANEITVQLGSDGAVDLFNLAGRTDAVVDLAGYHTATAAPSAPAAPLAGAYYSVAKYDVGDTNGGAIATVACKAATDTAISGGVQTIGLGDNGIQNNVPVSSSFPGRMDFTTNTPKAGRLDGWIVQFGTETGAAPKTVTIFALCVPGVTIPVDTTFTESGS